MKCFKCGSEMPDGAQFCGNCGAKLAQEQGQKRQDEQYEREKRQSGQYRRSSHTGTVSTKNGAADICLKIIAVVFAILYGISAIRSGVSFISNITNIFGGWFTGVSVLYMIVNVLTALSCALICFMLILTAFRRKSENADALCLGVCLAAILRILVGLVYMIVSFVSTIGYYYSPIRVYLLRFVETLFIAAVAAVVICVFLACMGELKVLGKEKGAVSKLLPELGDVITDACTGSSQPNKAKTSKTGRSEAAYDYKPGDYSQDNLKPAFALKTDRSVVAYILLSIITCGFYGYYFQYSIARDVNQACEGDGEKTGGLVAYILLCFITCGFYGMYWEYKLGNRLAQNGPRYGLQFQENGTSVLVWHLLGGLLCSLGIWVAMHILIKNTNRICQAYNEAHGL